MTLIERGGSPPKVVEDTLTIRGATIPVKITAIEQSRLRFFTANPRVYSALRADGVEPSQEEIERKLLEMDHVKALIQDIKRDGGLTDPVIVKVDTLEVLEGNSRLAAYRALARNDPIKWACMKCRVLPADIDEALVFALLGQYHIKGKKDWAPFEQAGFLYRRFKAHNLDAATLALEIGLSRRRVAHLIATYQFMLDHGEIDTARWSYYDEYLKSSIIKKARSRYSELDRQVIAKINSHEIPRAVDIRDRLPVICSAPKTLQKFASSAFDFEAAYEHAVDAGADSAPYKRLAKFRQWLAKPEVEAALGRAQGETRKKILFEFDKLNTRVQAIRRKIRPKG
jgi:hypothetical protein